MLAGGGEASRARQPRIRTYAQDWQSKAGSRDGATERGKKLKASRAGIAGGRSSQAGQLRTAAARILHSEARSSIRNRRRLWRLGGLAGEHRFDGSPLQPAGCSVPDVNLQFFTFRLQVLILLVQLLYFTKFH